MLRTRFSASTIHCGILGAIIDEGAAAAFDTDDPKSAATVGETPLGLFAAFFDSVAEDEAVDDELVLLQVVEAAWDARDAADAGSEGPLQST